MGLKVVLFMKKAWSLQAHFLSGEDDGVDYALIDADASLDDDFARERQQDAEDAYFDDVWWKARKVS